MIRRRYAGQVTLVLLALLHRRFTIEGFRGDRPRALVRRDLLRLQSSWSSDPGPDPLLVFIKRREPAPVDNFAASAWWGLPMHAGLDEAGYGRARAADHRVLCLPTRGTIDWSTLPDAVSDAPGQDERLVVADEEGLHPQPQGRPAPRATALTFHRGGNPCPSLQRPPPGAPDGLAPAPRPTRGIAPAGVAAPALEARGTERAPGAARGQPRRGERRGRGRGRGHPGWLPQRGSAGPTARARPCGPTTRASSTCSSASARASTSRATASAAGHGSGALSILVPFSSVRVLSESRQENRYLDLRRAADANSLCPEGDTSRSPRRSAPASPSTPASWSCLQ